MVRERKHFGVSVLKQEQQAISRYFAQTVEDEAVEARLGIRYRWTESGIPLLDDALVHIACKVIDTHAAGDHTIFIGQVETTEIFDGDPLIYFRGGYRKIEL